MKKLTIIIGLLFAFSIAESQVDTIFTGHPQYNATVGFITNGDDTLARYVMVDSHCWHLDAVNQEIKSIKGNINMFLQDSIFINKQLIEIRKNKIKYNFLKNKMLGK